MWKSYFGLDFNMYSQARAWERRKLDFACVNGKHESCLKLGKFYEQQNNKKANQYYEKACNLGFLKVCK